MRNAGFSAVTYPVDQHTVITYFIDYEITPADTLHIFSVLTSVLNGDESELQTSVDKAKRWCFQHVLPLCSSTCCILPLRGNVDYDPDDLTNIVDLTYLVAYLFGGGSPPECEEEADVNADLPVNTIDVTYLVAYLFGGGSPPQPCP